MAYNQTTNAYPNNTYNNNYPNSTNNTYNNNTAREPPPAYNEPAPDSSPYPSNNNQGNSGYPTTSSSLGGASILNQWQIRLTILLTILLTFSLFHLIPAAIANDVTSGIEIYDSRLAGLSIVFAGCCVPFLLIHFNVNGCVSYNASRTVNKICGALIIIGGIILLGANIAWIVETQENSSCADSDYVCCACAQVGLWCILDDLAVILIGVDLVSDFGNKQKSRVTLFSLVLIVASMLILIEWMANDVPSDSVSESQVAGLFGICIFGVLAIIAVFVGNAMMAKFV
eukprot:CAMPEP_0197043428 /NCGR_PEP_ID=MMETSP1384-20130603/19685_1 /TAXON_ID=29189 /ORGANISM="Ammonia sp." /LENGTH=284 /DNA_ID=CAMNT_0042474731 /DNA_START=18 /DNA_END=868 /DNA_ORIENTATION=-